MNAIGKNVWCRTVKREFNQIFLYRGINSYSNLREVTGNAVFVSLLYLIIREFDESVVLLSQLGIEDAIIFELDFGFSIFYHAFADQTNLSESEERLIPTGRSHETRSFGPGRGSCRSSSGTIRTVASIKFQLLSSMELFNFFSNIFSDLFRS